MNPQDEYLETQVMTAQPQQLHLMVLDGAIRYAKHAAATIEDHDFESTHLALSRSRDFICELLSGLDPSQSPDVVLQLKELFLFAYRHLIRADVEHDVQLILDAIQIMEMHRETWVALMKRLLQESLQPADQQASSAEHQPPPPHQAFSDADTGIDSSYQQRSWTT